MGGGGGGGAGKFREASHSDEILIAVLGCALASKYLAFSSHTCNWQRFKQ